MPAIRSLKSLLALRLPEDASAIAALPPPEKFAGAVSPADRYPIAVKYWTLWRALIEHTAPSSFTKPPEGLTSEMLWARLALTIGSYYAFAVEKFIVDEPLPDKDAFLPGLNLPATRELLQSLAREDESDNDKGLRLAATGLMASYCLSLTASYFLRPTSIYPAWSPKATIEAAAHSNLDDLARAATSRPSPELQMLGGRLLTSATSILLNIYERAAEGVNKEHPIGPFSLMRLGELAAVARRDKRISDLYGIDLARLFEQQLALVLQSLGFYVISTRTAERSVDLLCISGDPMEQFTILVEAKTSARAYSLPAKDERALREYVDEVRRRLRTMPPLRFVLLVGPEPAKTLAGKLRRLEATTGTPFRYVRAASLAALRERLPGTAPMRVLADSVLLAGPILGATFGDDAIAKWQAEQAAHDRFVRSLFDLPVDH